MSFLSKLLPTIASCLGSPLAGAAVEVVGKALGMSEATTDKVQRALSSGTLTAEQIGALQAADLQLKARMAELGIDAEKLAAEDRANARAMQGATGSWVPAALAVTLTSSYLLIISLLLTGDMKLWSDPTLTLLLGGLTSGFTAVLGFYFGASHKQPEAHK